MMCPYCHADKRTEITYDCWTKVGDDELALRKKAAAVLAKEIDSRVKTSTGFTPYKDAAEGKVAEASANNWYQQLVSGNKDLQVRAANELRMRKLPDGDMIQATTVESEPQADGSQKNYVKLLVKSPTASTIDRTYPWSASTDSASPKLEVETLSHRCACTLQMPGFEYEKEALHQSPRKPPDAGPHNLHTGCRTDKSRPTSNTDCRQ